MTILRVDSGIFRGPRPQTDEDWKQLQSLGIKYSLDLQNGQYFDSSALEEQFKSKGYGIETFSHPLGQILPPTKLELNLAHRTIQQYKPIYVHCKAGVDRTGMVIAYYENGNGFTKAQAIDRMKSFGMHFWYYYWAWFL